MPPFPTPSTPLPLGFEIPKLHVQLVMGSSANLEFELAASGVPTLPFVRMHP